MVNAVGDNKIESNETFVVNLTNPVGASIADAQGTGTITNDDAAQISIDDVTQNEGNSGNTAYSFTISIDNPSISDVTVTYATANGTATTADNDYTSITGLATISAGDTSTTIDIQAIGDLQVEADETFVVNLSNPTGATINDAQGTATITNDDLAGFSVTPTTFTLDEGNTGIFSIVLTAQPLNDVLIDISSADTGAVSPSTTGLTFTNANWDSPQIITIKAEEDADLNNENVILSASINTSSDDQFTSLANQTVNVTVNDDDTDNDQDGIPDEDDLDDDNDGNPDTLDPNPLVARASDDTLGGEVEAGTPIKVNILANDDFIAGAQVSITNTGNGNATGLINFDPVLGELTYTPETAEQGQLVSIEYEVCNTAVNPEVCAIATVSLLVANAPVVVPPESIPTLSEWMLIILSLLLLIVGWRMGGCRKSSGF